MHFRLLFSTVYDPLVPVTFSSGLKATDITTSESLCEDILKLVLKTARARVHTSYSQAHVFFTRKEFWNDLRLYLRGAIVKNWRNANDAT